MKTIGQSVGLLVLVSRDPGRRARWTCRCVCGRTISVREDTINTSRPDRSCGCRGRAGAAGAFVGGRITTDRERQFLIRERSIPEPMSGCWLWLWRLEKTGYGTMSSGGESTTAHRASYEAFIGHIPTGMVVRHRCDVRCCVNPDHLLIGTHADNVHDMWRRGRQPLARATTAKLSAEQVASLRAEFSTGVRQASLVEKYGVSPAQVSRIVNGTSWRNVLNEHGVTWRRGRGQVAVKP